jgi:acetoin utilization deacetylase AcuC-like enzyme
VKQLGRERRRRWCSRHSARSYEIALLSAGGAIAAVDAPFDGRVLDAYALIRPPGHHAEADQGMGFASSRTRRSPRTTRAARGPRARGDRRLGRTTATAARARSTATRACSRSPSTRQLLPPGAALEDGGEGPGLGYNLNVPPLPGSGHGAYEAVFARVVAPALRPSGPSS